MIRVPGGERADDGGEQHEGGGERAEIGAVGECGAEAAMTIENSPRAMSVAAGAAAGRGARSRPDRRDLHPVSDLRRRSPTTASAAAGASTPTRSPGRIWNEKNRKNVAANRSRSGPISARRSVLHRARQREADEERADRGRHLELLGEPADQQASARTPRAAATRPSPPASRSLSGRAEPDGERQDHGDRRAARRSTVNDVLASVLAGRPGRRRSAGTPPSRGPR